MTLMLDTGICIELIRRRPSALITAITARAVGDVGISVVTLAELEYGVAKSSRPSANREALARFVAPLEVVPFDRAAAVVYGTLRAGTGEKGPGHRLDGPHDRGARREPPCRTHDRQRARVRTRPRPAHPPA